MTITYAPAIIPAVLPRTADQVRAVLLSELGQKGIPNGHWPIKTGEDCLGFLTWGAGIRPREDLATPLTGIGAFLAAAGWHVVRGAANIRVNDWPLWDWDEDGEPDHATFAYSIDRTHNELVTVEANTGPHVGDDIEKHPELRGIYRKERPLNESALWGAIRPPYPVIVPASKDRKAVLTAATYLDKVMPASIHDESRNRTIQLPRTDAGNHGTVKGDGLRGPLYRRLVQAWGRVHGIYGVTFRIDDTFGPRSEYVEDVLFRQLKVG